MSVLIYDTRYQKPVTIKGISDETENVSRYSNIFSPCILYPLLLTNWRLQFQNYRYIMTFRLPVRHGYVTAERIFPLCLVSLFQIPIYGDNLSSPLF